MPEYPLLAGLGLIDWAWDEFSPTRASQVLDRSERRRIDWRNDA